MCRYDVDATNRITFVDENWCAFARANGAPEYAEPSVLYGAALFSFVSDLTTQHVYSVLMDRVRAQQVAIRVPFRCDSPTRRRWLELEMSPRADLGITFVSREVRSEAREAVPALDAAARAEETIDRLVRMCSWCKRVDAGTSGWIEPELAVGEMALFSSEPRRAITHGICPQCVTLFETGAGYSIDPV